MRLFCPAVIVLLLAAAPGCGTSKWTDTGRSATEQLLITNTMDRAVSKLDFRALAGKTTYIDQTALKKITDAEYLVSCMRQHMLANGCLVKDIKTEADYIVEVRVGAVGTDRHDVLYGVPAVNIPTVVPVSGIPTQVPEMPIIKKTEQRAVVKLSVFAYNRKTGRPIWQSGAVPEESDAKAVWVLGAGPFQSGSIFDGMEFAGNTLDIPLIDLYRPTRETVSVADEAYFVEPEEQIAEEVATDQPTDKTKPAPKASAVVPASHTSPGPPKTMDPPPPAPAPRAPSGPVPAPPVPAEPPPAAIPPTQPTAQPIPHPTAAIPPTQATQSLYSHQTAPAVPQLFPDPRTPLPMVIVPRQQAPYRY